jgi:hypothetical protein
MEQKLKMGRYWHTAFLVPDNIVDCNWRTFLNLRQVKIVLLYI